MKPCVFHLGHWSYHSQEAPSGASSKSHCASRKSAARETNRGVRKQTEPHTWLLADYIFFLDRERSVFASVDRHQNEAEAAFVY